MITIKEVKTTGDISKFVNFPIKLYEGNEFYVPPLLSSERENFSPTKNASYDECDIVAYLAFSGKQVVGRIMGIIQKTYNKKISEKRVRFSRFECIDDQEVANLLFDSLIKWAKEKGMEIVHGPLDFNDLGREGLLIEGFEELATFEENYNFPYYKKLIENYGFQKENDWLAFQIPKQNKIDPRLQKMSDVILKRYDLKVIHEKKMSTFLKKYSKSVFTCIDEAYSPLLGVVPYNEQVQEQLIAQFKLLLNLRYMVAIANKEDEVVAFGFALPSMAKAVKKSKGRLFPFGVFRILKAVSKPNVWDFGVIAIRPQYQGKGLTAIIMNYVFSEMSKLDLHYIETNHSLEDNKKILLQWNNFDGVRQHKRFRCYIKNI